MELHYVRELDCFSKSEILEILEKEEVLEELTDYLIINAEKDKYQFNYVGIIITNDIVINCYPKYIPNEENIKNDFKQVLRVIKKYKKHHKNIDYENDNLINSDFNLLSMMIFFLEDYFENGVYTSYENTIKINGNGEIDWNKTINDTYPIIKSNMPYYVELYTKHKFNDSLNYFRLLHEYIVSECSRRLEYFGLIELFDLTPVNLSDNRLEDFGSVKFIIKKLKNELNIEFNTHKQDLLKSMEAYLSLTNSFSNKDILTVYGTSNYNVIWENMISDVFDNKLNKTLFELGLDDNDMSLKDIIEKPIWYLEEGEFKTDAFKPDFITIYNNNFIILDAKYYKLRFNGDKLEKQPKLGDVTKQYLYQLAYNDFIEEYDLEVKNAFLLPTYDDSEIRNRGHVKLKILSECGLEDIQVLMIPANKLNKLYLNDDKWDISYLVEKL